MAKHPPPTRSTDLWRVARRAWDRAVDPPPTIPPLRRAPVHLAEPEQREVYRILNFALTAGGMVLGSGSGTFEAEATIRDLARACGLEHCEVDVTFTSLTASFVRAEDVAPVTALHVIRRRSVDYGRLAAVYALREQLTSGGVTPEEAFGRLRAVASAPPRRSRLVLVSWALMAAAFTVLLGGGALVAGVAFASTVAVTLVNGFLRGRSIPDFFLAALGSALATGFAIALAMARVDVHSALVVAGGIMVLVPGYALVASVQDAVTGFPISGSARGLEVAVTATGIVSGVALALYVAEALGMSFHLGTLSLTSFVRLPLQVAAAGAAAALYGAATSVPRRFLPLAGLSGAIGWGSLLLLEHGRVSSIPATALAAMVVGVLANVVAARYDTHPFLFIVPGVMPLVPGLTIYNGMLQLFAGQGGGQATLLQAVAVGLAIAVGVTFGALLVRPLGRRAGRPAAGA